MERRQTFDAVASLYAAVRPGYPDVLFEDLTRLARLDRSAVVLEVGCGAGQATAALAARAKRLVALDPGANLLAEAEARVGSANVEYVQSLFETYADGAQAFDLVASAQAWHWIAPEISLPKAASLLARHGWLAVFGHVPMPVPEPFKSLFKASYEAHAPELWGSPPLQAAYLPSGPFPRLIEAAGLFGPVAHRCYPWRWVMTGEVLERYLRTDSSFSDFPEERRNRLFEAMRAAVVAQGDRLDAPWETHLYMAQKR